MPEPFPQDAAWLDTLAHVTLQLGRILLSNGSDTEQVQVSLTRFAAAFGADANLLVTYEAVLVSLAAGGHIRTKVGHRVPGMGVGMAAIEAINRLVDDADNGRLRLDDVPSALDAIEHRSPTYPRWLVAIALGVTECRWSLRGAGTGRSILGRTSHRTERVPSDIRR